MEAPAAAKDETLAIVAEAASETPAATNDDCCSSRQSKVPLETPAAASGVTLAAIADAASKAEAAPQKGAPAAFAEAPRRREQKAML